MKPGDAIYDAVDLWRLPEGTTFREEGDRGRTFTSMRPGTGKAWWRHVPLPVRDVELPVHITHIPTTSKEPA
ncbi:hypothetical protein [Rhodococcus rhodnii]|uniref:Uncharacterized protein n=2 Tax=Rhodococcus rhodnii TaxID=38312 RepID=R7WRV0_9NOCA|nr:hypothetical protein [Rhodococcus rhodnii]EOM78036.1 hypothetical protein Rrhod_0577 [Rhodococcus rhodnii LMG 5362]